MINSYDNSVTYVNSFISSIMIRFAIRKRLCSTQLARGESINEREHLHGTPRELAPPEGILHVTDDGLDVR